MILNSNSSVTLSPCPQIVESLERIAEGKEKGGIFMWYVRKHIERCDHCRDALDALICYQDAIKKAYEDADFEPVSSSELDSIFASAKHL